MGTLSFTTLFIVYLIACKCSTLLSPPASGLSGIISFTVSRRPIIMGMWKVDITMNEKTLYKLEYDKIIDLLTEKASSFGGRSRCRRLKPMTSIEKIEVAQQETEAAFQRIVKKGRPSFGGCAPVNESLKRLEIGGTLGSGELLRICRLLENAGQVKAYGRRENGDESTDCLDGYFDQLTPILPLTSEIRRCILEEDEISDDASPALRQIRRQIGQIND